MSLSSDQWEYLSSRQRCHHLSWYPHRHTDHRLPLWPCHFHRQSSVLPCHNQIRLLLFYSDWSVPEPDCPSAQTCMFHFRHYRMWSWHSLIPHSVQRPFLLHHPCCILQVLPFLWSYTFRMEDSMMLFHPHQFLLSVLLPRHDLHHKSHRQRHLAVSLSLWNAWSVRSRSSFHHHYTVRTLPSCERLIWSERHLHLPSSHVSDLHTSDAGYKHRLPAEWMLLLLFRWLSVYRPHLRVDRWSEISPRPLAHICFYWLTSAF